MIQLTKSQYALLKQRIQDAEPDSEEYYSVNGGYYFRCCDMDTRYEHGDKCPKMAWYALVSYVDRLGEENAG